MKLLINVTIKSGTDPTELADAILNYLCDGGDGNIDYPSAILSVDECDPYER